MAGFAIVYGSDRKAAGAMMAKMDHRGPYAFGVYQADGLIMAQNYLRADGAVAGEPVPLRSQTHPRLVICYDGQMGDWPNKALAHGVVDGSLREERLLLTLYEKYGAGLLDHLDDAVFAFAIQDGGKLLVARDLLGIKTLFYARAGDTLYFSSELKGIREVADEVYEFPNGCFMDEHGELTRFAELPQQPPNILDCSVHAITEGIRSIVERSFGSRIDFTTLTGGLLSGGLDSSVVCSVASRAKRARFGQQARLKTFAIGLGESPDVVSARQVAAHIDSEHCELIVGLEEALEVLPDVVYYLESFDPSLVRSSVSNYLVSRLAREAGIETLLSGEGGDEVFCGYKYLEQYTPEELFARQMECLGYLHNNASLRLDRMNMCHSIRVVAPLVSGELLRYAMAIPPELKQMPDQDGKIEKWVFRKAYEGALPQSVVWRTKAEFSQGSGSADTLPVYFEQTVSNAELKEAQARHPFIRSKEELHYFRLFTDCFGADHAIRTVGQWPLL